MFTGTALVTPGLRCTRLRPTVAGMGPGDPVTKKGIQRVTKMDGSSGRELPDRTTILDVYSTCPAVTENVLCPKLSPRLGDAIPHQS